MNIQDQRASKSSWISSNIAPSSKRYRSSQQQSHELFRTSQGIACCLSKEDATERSPRNSPLYYGDRNLYRICVDSRHTIERCPFMSSDLQTLENEQQDTFLPNQSESKPRAIYGRGSEPFNRTEMIKNYFIKSYYGRRVSGYGHTASN